MSVILIVIAITFGTIGVASLLGNNEACADGCTGIAGLILAFFVGLAGIAFAVLGIGCASLLF